MKKPPHPLALRLHEERKKARLTRPQVAGRIHVSTEALSSWEWGRSEPASLANIDAWAAVYGLRLALVPIEEER
ncbi:MAG TPA: helix-turn-helix transcriptional regulator [Jiangellaceae bacterium]|jgi:DNA-binding transcriptional regulator YiaG